MRGTWASQEGGNGRRRFKVSLKATTLCSTAESQAENTSKYTTLRGCAAALRDVSVVWLSSLMLCFVRGEDVKLR